MACRPPAFAAGEESGNPVVEFAEASGEESLEDLAGLLMRQIRGSDFLERNPATGPSLFDLAALHQDAGSEDMEVLMGASAAQPGSADGMESVEDLARKLVLQLRSGGEGSLEFLGASQGVAVCEGASVLLDAGHKAERTAGGKPLPSAGKPRLGDALGTILGQLDAGPVEGKGARMPVDLSDSPEDQQLVEAFAAMAPTLDALFADLAGELPDDDTDVAGAAGRGHGGGSAGCGLGIAGFSAGGGGGENGAVEGVLSAGGGDLDALFGELALGQFQVSVGTAAGRFQVVDDAAG